MMSLRRRGISPCMLLLCGLAALLLRLVCGHLFWIETNRLLDLALRAGVAQRVPDERLPAAGERRACVQSVVCLQRAQDISPGW